MLTVAMIAIAFLIIGYICNAPSDVDTVERNFKKAQTEFEANYAEFRKTMKHINKG